MLEYAIKYAAMGLSVIPVHSVTNGKCSCGASRCSSPGKHPRIKWKENTVTALTIEQLKEWWDQYPDSNVGIVTGEVSGIAVIDIDGEEGLNSLREAGIPLEELPPTVSSKTGGGGIHLIYRYPERCAVKTKAGVLKRVDIRADGGFIVAPPSIHVSGGRYEWTNNIEDMDPADFDFSLLPGATEGSSKSMPEEKIKLGSSWYDGLIQGVKQGGRNEAATRLAGRYFGMGMSSLEVTLMLRSWNTLNEPPLSARELDTIVQSIQGREAVKDERDSSDYLRNLSRILRMNLISVKRITGDDPKFILQFDTGSCTLTTGMLLSPKAFQQAIAEATKVVINKLSNKTNPTHERLAQMIMNCAEEVDAGIEATEVGEVMVLIRDFLHSQNRMVEVGEDEKFPARGSFKYQGLVWIDLQDLIQRGGLKWGMRNTMPQMAQKLKALGIDSRVFNCDGGVTRTMRGIDPLKSGFLPEEIRDETTE